MSAARWAFDTTPVTWQRRTLRYLAIYLALALLLVGARYLSQDVRPDLRAAQQREEELIAMRDDLTVRVQAATTPQKVQTWATENGMQRFAESRKAVRDLGAAAVTPPPADTARDLEVKTQWK
ncbi:hypothetical protein [Deinococcus gobiensis]|uniref:hypothetical protein n=1 Tax=Deinococcus gobiensis TaxID=502394 RepID=UPI0002E1369F|nr:hypothetical protein [Deinococcus gobiensis]